MYNLIYRNRNVVPGPYSVNLKTDITM